jgi:hypothetical protein
VQSPSARTRSPQPARPGWCGWCGAPPLTAGRREREIAAVFGASTNELALVALLLVLVVLAPKVPRIGEWLGTLLVRGDPGPARVDDADEPGAEPHRGDGAPGDEPPR